NAERLEQLLRDLLDLERLTREEVTANQREEDLAELVADAMAELDEGEHDLTAVLEPATVSAEPRLVERIVENLVRNAQRHTPPGTAIRVLVAPQPDGALLVVEDDGPGIDDEVRDRLFDPFVQGSSARRSPTPGTGIGLSLVQRFTQLQGGRVWIEGSASGGARFCVWLPAFRGQGHHSTR
ncbi:MAG: ATP-binding protein, partial [Nitriliruptorales bacterium]|nr:ATP-binding protein [Nitriliruptorales bacterium]